MTPIETAAILGARNPTLRRSQDGEAKSFGYIASLDGLRAIAVLSVIFGHTTPYAPGGSIGVDIFFVLSGFLITSILRQEHAKTGRIRLGNFYIRRFLRLTPALWTLAAAYIAMSLVEWALGIGPGMKNVLAATLAAVTYTMNWIRAFHLGPEGLLGHTWSLSVEEQFYLLWPLLLIGLLRLCERNARLCIALIASASILLATWMTWRGVDVFRIYNGFDTRCWELLIGCLLAFMKLEAMPAIYARAWPFPVFFLAVCMFGTGNYVRAIHEWLLPLVTLAAAWWIASLVARDGKVRSYLERPGFVATGKISYGLYLWHYPLMLAIGPRWHPLLFFALVTALSYAFATLSYLMIERPALMLKKRYEAPIRVT